jgi:hypothetical protein
MLPVLQRPMAAVTGQGCMRPFRQPRHFENQASSFTPSTCSRSKARTCAVGRWSSESVSSDESCRGSIHACSTLVISTHEASTCSVKRPPLTSGDCWKVAARSVPHGRHHDVLDQDQERRVFAERRPTRTLPPPKHVTSECPSIVATDAETRLTPNPIRRRENQRPSVAAGPAV